MREFIKKLFYLLCLPLSLIAKYKKGIAVSIFEYILRAYYDDINTFAHCRISDISNKQISAWDDDDIAFIVQGPIRYENNFTYNMLNYYRKIYPKAYIVVSTWKNEVTDSLRSDLDEIKVDIIENDLPDKPGYGHVNYQLHSTIAGLKSAKNKNIKYAIKIRTDQIFYKPNLIKNLKNQLTLYPSTNNNINKRLILLGHVNSYINIPYHISEYLCFGTIDAVFSFYDSPLDMTDHDYSQHNKPHFYPLARIISYYELDRNIDNAKKEKILKIISSYVSAEIYIIKNYCMRLHDFQINDDYKAYLQFLEEYCIILDSSDLMMCFPKYSKVSLSDMYASLGGGLDHALWLDIMLKSKVTKQC